MLEESLLVLKNFRDKIYQFFPSRRDAAMELVDSLSSNTSAKSVVELSLNPLHRRNYCSITRVLGEYRSKDTLDLEQQEDRLTKILSELCISEQKRRYHLFAVDCTPGPRVFSPTLEDRSYVYAPNTVCGNKPVTVGHKYSIAAYLPEKESPQVPPWLIPLSCTRIDTSQDGELVGMKQLSDCIKSQSSFSNQLCVSLGDTAYNKALCLGIAKKNTNQVHISRARNNRKFFYSYIPSDTSTSPKRGRPKAYGDVHQLNNSKTWRVPDESIELMLRTSKGIIQNIKIECWNELLMRGKKGCKLSDYPLRLLRVRVYKESGELLFKRPLWLTAFGSRRLELSLIDIFNCYRQRFDLEHFFRIGKTRLLMDKIQTPDVCHEESWWQIVIIAYAQLYLSRNLANNLPKPWEKYLPAFKANGVIKQPTQVQKDFARIIQAIGTPAQPPKTRKKAAGRKLGDFQIKRKRYEIVKKTKIKPEKEKNAA